jgi:hypothetical protein
MSKSNKIQSESIESLKQKIERDINIGSENDNLSANTIKLYLRQVLKLYKSGLAEHSWSHDEFIDRVHHPNYFDDRDFEKIYKAKSSDIVKLVLSLYKSKESLVLTFNALCKMVKNRFKRTFDYYNKIRKELSKQNKSDKLDNELTPEEDAKYISYDELMSVPVKLKSAIIQSYGQLFISRGDYEAMTKTKQSEYLKLVFDYITLYLNVHYPLRLVWPTVLLQKIDGANYLGEVSFT